MNIKAELAAVEKMRTGELLERFVTDPRDLRAMSPTRCCRSTPPEESSGTLSVLS